MIQLQSLPSRQLKLQLCLPSFSTSQPLLSPRLHVEYPAPVGVWQILNLPSNFSSNATCPQTNKAILPLMLALHFAYVAKVSELGYIHICLLQINSLKTKAMAFSHWLSCLGTQ